MKTFQIISYDANGSEVVTYVTEQEIHNTYWNDWCECMTDKGDQSKISWSACLDDWKSEHSAIEIELL